MEARGQSSGRAGGKGRCVGVSTYHPPSLQQELINLFAVSGARFQDFTSSFTEPDFLFLSPKWNYAFWLEAKEKVQTFSKKNWPCDIPEKHLFVLDDLSARKVLRHAPFSGVLVRDNTQRQYVFFSVVHLFTMPKIRRNRLLPSGEMKGKWLIDLRHGESARTLPQALAHITRYVRDLTATFASTPAWGVYEGEDLRIAGVPRTNEHRRQDIAITR